MSAPSIKGEKWLWAWEPVRAPDKIHPPLGAAGMDELYRADK